MGQEGKNQGGGGGVVWSMKICNWYVLTEVTLSRIITLSFVRITPSNVNALWASSESLKKRTGRMTFVSGSPISMGGIIEKPTSIDDCQNPGVENYDAEDGNCLSVNKS